MQTHTKKIKVAIIGFGYWGPNLARNFFNSDLYELVGIADMYNDNLEIAKKTYQHILVTKEYTDFFDNFDVELIAIATPIDTHYTIAKNCLSHNKHILVEKPFTVSVSQADELINLASKHACKIAVDHTFLYSSAVREIKKHYDDNDIGDMFTMTSERLNLGRIKEDHNVVWDLAVHDFSIFTYLLNGLEPLSVQCTTKQYTESNQSEVAFVTIMYPKNILAHIHVSWLHPLKTRRMIFLGSKKMIYFDDIEVDKKLQIIEKNIEFVKKDDHPFNPTYRVGNTTVPLLDKTESLQREIVELYEYIRNDKPFISDGIFGRKIIMMLEYISILTK